MSQTNNTLTLEEVKYIAEGQLNGDIDSVRAKQYWRAILEKDDAKEELAGTLATVFSMLFQKIHNIKRL